MFRDIIMRRTSVRTFSGDGITPAQAEALRRACKEAEAPFGGIVFMALLHFGDGGELRPGTYGVIRGARDFLVLATDGSDPALLSGGFAMERIVLEAESMGLGSCWIGATFSGTPFAAAAARAGMPDGMRIAAVLPVGVAAGRRHLLERIMRAGIRESSRKPYGRLFFRGRFDHPLAEGEGPYAQALEAVRRAPSAVNGQPWRVLVDADGRRVRFFMARRSRYIMLDMGIALCHFALTAAPGRFVREAGAPHPDGGPEYLITYEPAL